MHFNPYGGLAAQLAADLVNAGPTASADAIAALLHRLGYQPVGRVTAAQARALGQWSNRIRPVFDDTRLQPRVALLNELLASTAARPFISQHDGRAPHLHFADVKAGLAERIAAYTAAGLAQALCEDPGRLGSCDREGCGVVFVDTSRNGRRRFCSTRCSTRVHVAAHRAASMNSPIRTG